MISVWFHIAFTRSVSTTMGGGFMLSKLLQSLAQYTTLTTCPAPMDMIALP